MAQPIVDPGLQDPKAVVGNDAVIFGELLGWGARLAIGTFISLVLMYAELNYLVDIYTDRKQNWIKDEVMDRVRHLDNNIARYATFPSNRRWGSESICCLALAMSALWRDSTFQPHWTPWIDQSACLQV